MRGRPYITRAMCESDTRPWSTDTRPDSTRGVTPLDSREDTHFLSVPGPVSQGAENPSGLFRGLWSAVNPSWTPPSSSYSQRVLPAPTPTPRFFVPTPVCRADPSPFPDHTRPHRRIRSTCPRKWEVPTNRSPRPDPGTFLVQPTRLHRRDRGTLHSPAHGHSPVPFLWTNQNDLVPKWCFGRGTDQERRTPYRITTRYDAYRGDVWCVVFVYRLWVSSGVSKGPGLDRHKSRLPRCSLPG